jgi:hypothetical protein
MKMYPMGAEIFHVGILIDRHEAIESFFIILRALKKRKVRKMWVKSDHLVDLKTVILVLYI